jgi:3-oxoacyl-[acyl-carrier protein] reductase
MRGEFTDKVIWVVGASGGLGSATARAFLQAGGKVALSGRSEPKLRSALGSGDQTRALLLPIDITRESEVKQAATEITARFGRLDVLVNSTSVSTFGDFLQLTDEMWRQVYEAKLFAYARTMRAAIPQMLEQQSGAIVNVSGSGGK